MSSNFSTLERTISHGVVQHHIPSGDEPIFPQLTEAGPHTDAFQQETNTGLVLASEVEPHSGAGSLTSTLVHSPKDPEKGGFDAKLVTFTEGDPSNPRNFSKTKKWTATMLATLLCFDSGFASSIITGGLTPMRQQFNVSVDIINLSVCFFVVGFGVGPLFFAPLSEMYGRRVIYLISMAFFFIFTIPCAVAQNVETLIVCRFLAGLGASAPMTNAGGTIGDVWAVNERGNKMAAFSSILFASPCLGPLVGGYISESVSWRWIYWVLLIFSGVCWLIAFAFLPETYAPTILRWRAEQLRKETGDDTIQTEQERQRRSAADIAKQSLLRPLQMLFTEPIMICFSGYLCLIYGLLYAFFFAYPIIFEEGHGFTAGQVGLTFLSILVGIVLVGAFACPLQERYYQRKIREGGGSTVPESRLPLMMICSLLLPISLFIFAWTSNPNTHWAGALVSGIPFGFALVGIYISANNYLVDVYLRYGASAMAAKTFIRSLAGASASQWVFLMYRRLGNEWAGSLLAFLAVGMAPIPFIFYLKGAGIRTRSPMAN